MNRNLLSVVTSVVSAFAGAGSIWFVMGPRPLAIEGSDALLFPQPEDRLQRIGVEHKAEDISILNKVVLPIPSETFAALDEVGKKPG